MERTLKYKKKRQGWPAARLEFARYLSLVRALRQPAIDLPDALIAELDVTNAVGKAYYKEREDRLDAVFCAYLGALAVEGHRSGDTIQLAIGAQGVAIEALDEEARSDLAPDEVNFWSAPGVIRAQVARRCSLRGVARASRGAPHTDRRRCAPR